MNTPEQTTIRHTIDGIDFALTADRQLVMIEAPDGDGRRNLIALGTAEAIALVIFITSPGVQETIDRWEGDRQAGAELAALVDRPAIVDDVLDLGQAAYARGRQDVAGELIAYMVAKRRDIDARRWEAAERSAAALLPPEPAADAGEAYARWHLARADWLAGVWRSRGDDPARLAHWEAESNRWRVVLGQQPLPPAADTRRWLAVEQPTLDALPPRPAVAGDAFEHWALAEAEALAQLWRERGDDPGRLAFWEAEAADRREGLAGADNGK